MKTNKSEINRLVEKLEKLTSKKIVLENETIKENDSCPYDEDGFDHYGREYDEEGNLLYEKSPSGMEPVQFYVRKGERAKIKRDAHAKGFSGISDYIRSLVL